MKRGLDLKTGLDGKKAGSAAKLKRFWKDVHVKRVDGMDFFSFLRNSFYKLGS